MKTRVAFQKTVSFLAIILFIFFMFGVRMASAQLPSGDMCWTIKITQNEKGPTSMTRAVKMHMVPLDSQQASVSGIVSIPKNNPFLLMGTASRVGSSLILNLTTTQKHKSEPWRDTGTMQATLNPTTLSGTFWTVSKDFNTVTHEFTDGYASGTLTKKATCP